VDYILGFRSAVGTLRRGQSLVREKSSIDFLPLEFPDPAFRATKVAEHTIDLWDDLMVRGPA
jgi:hypothetical protein